MARIHAAVRHIMERDEEADQREYSQMGICARKGLSALAGVRSVKRRQQTVQVRFDADCVGLAGADLAAALLDGDPSILAWCRGEELSLNLTTLQEGEMDQVVERLQQLLA